MSAAARVSDPRGRVTRDDLAAKFRELQGEVDEVADEAVNYVLVAGVVLAVGVVVTAYLLGRRKGRAKSAVIEVRRL